METELKSLVNKYQLESVVEVKSKPHPWVSRGGIKLDKAISEFGLSCQR